MDHPALVGLDIESGARILSALDQAHIQPAVALWMTSPEYEEGRLVLASGALDQAHPLRAYEEVARVLHKHSLSAEPPLLILSLKDPFISTLRTLFAKATNVRGMRLGGQSIGNRFVSDAYVYRIS